MDAIQYKTNTFLRREESLFKCARSRLTEKGHGSDLRILSFGCSIGDEVATLRLLFPRAEIVGCDVDDAALEAAQRSVGHLAKIIRSDEASLRAHGPFDLIVACSVLCLNPKPKDFLARFPFSRFEDTLGLLDSLLAPAGLIAVTNASYRFRDTALAANYDVVRADLVWSNGFVDVMDREGVSILIQAAAPSSPFYRKGEAYTVGDDEDLADSIFEKRTAGLAKVHWVMIAERPENLASVSAFERTNTDGLPSVPDDALIITTRFEFVVDEATGAETLATQVRWPSMNGGVHHRPWCLLDGNRRPLQRTSPR